MKRKLLEIMALMLVGLPLIAGNVDFKFSGPAGQGDWIWWSRLTGVTNMVMGANGISYLHCATGAAVITNATLTLQTGAVTASGTVTPAIATNVAVTTTNLTYLSATGVTSTVTVVSGVTVQTVASGAVAVTVVGGGAVVTNVTLSNP